MKSLLLVTTLIGLSTSQTNYTQANNTGVGVLPVNITTIPNLNVDLIYDRPPVVNYSGQLYNYTQGLVQRKVAWYTAGNLAIIDGDIIFGTVADLQAAKVSDGNTKRAYSLFTHEVRKWPGGKFQYKWQSQDLKNRKGAIWDQAVKLWTDRVPFIKFEEVAVPSTVLSPAGGPVTLVDKSDICPGCSFSWVGRAQTNEANTLILGDCGSCAPSYAHEIGHSLGLHHEHQRPDRDEHITIHCENIMDQISGGVSTKAVCPVSPGGTCQGWGCAFEKMPVGFADASTPYDVHSLLHYRSTSFCDPNDCQKTITGISPNPDPVDGIAPSLGDAKRICELYFEECAGVGVCGNGIVDPNEECDDGNNIDGDGCSSNCKFENLCGNGVLDPGEYCDYGPLLNGRPGTGCDSKCQKTSYCPLTTCDPRPGKNLCHSSTSCVKIEDSLAWTGNPTHLCACAHGFRAKGVTPDDVSKEIRIPGEQWPSQKGRVFVNPGVECTELCLDHTLGADGCQEASALPDCFKP